MFLLKWYAEYLMIKSQWRRDKTDITLQEKQVEICESCETLKEQLALANQREQKLMDRLLEKPEKTVVEAPHKAGPPLMPTRVPWRVRQQMLEAEDREKAKLMREAPQPATTDVADLEKELNIASAERNAEATGQVS